MLEIYVPHPMRHAGLLMNPDHVIQAYSKDVFATFLQSKNNDMRESWY
jgi:hypothetical protein